MKITFKYALAYLLTLSMAVAAMADEVNLLPGDISQGSTDTSFFTDGTISLTPFIGNTQDTFNNNAVRLGIDSTGTANANAFNDSDTDPGNGNEERLTFGFVANAGLTRIAYDFSRADGTGPEDGVIISGFLSDPGVTFSVSNANLFAEYDAVAGSVRINIPGSLFNGNDVDINFDAASSNGQLLSMSVTDTDQAGAQFAITGIGYENQISAVPEPATGACITLFGLAAFTRRRRV
ncbi:PEP-CTERM sorting domain-containing protein [Mariniblastus fucicola]|uniref:PEP-CTERM protein-sorting domain-containing protein n=1 Tax=Mariniblastus fucicola TaxID=980251 RepID=A0A5B9PDX7_9BACT|nr:PEP-CTERM sorting domain-containing protein [Mariniblastus fucicola]QEG23405.1 hypothetical protein MFFC18_33030 [Mariniblastus fucicola]